jgi:hypothetical protein
VLHEDDDRLLCDACGGEVVAWLVDDGSGDPLEGHVERVGLDRRGIQRSAEWRQRQGEELRRRLSAPDVRARMAASQRLRRQRERRARGQ